MTSRRADDGILGAEEKASKRQAIRSKIPNGNKVDFLDIKTKPVLRFVETTVSLWA
jgi:hypothetical protein